MLIREAVLKEISRKGQVFILYNNITDMESIVNKYKKLIPEVRICYAHGKMNKDEMQDVIYDFTNGPYMTHCTLDLDEDAGWEGTCDSFKEEVLDKEYINDEACEFTDEQIKAFWDTVKEAHEKEVENLEPFLTSPPKPGTPIGKERKMAINRQNFDSLIDDFVSREVETKRLRRGSNIYFVRYTPTELKGMLKSFLNEIEVKCPNNDPDPERDIMSQEKLEKLYSEAIDAMRKYSGRHNDHD
jgi:hypothetical protein